jgi:hypothetical protein
MIRRSQVTHGPWKKISLYIASTSALLITLGASAIGQRTDRRHIDIQNLFTPSGWMGDGEYGRKYIDFSESDQTNPHSSPSSIRVTYTFGPKRWGGLYWQNQPDNWGDKPGFDYSNKGFSKLTFWARGATGGEVIEFKVGGIDDPRKKYRDSLAVTTGRVTLTKTWTQHTIDLTHTNLSSVIGGFCWVASADYNARGEMTFYLDDIAME